jgi:DNA-binding phage protein
MHLPPLFDSWDCQTVALPHRSRLYPLKPIGIGTPFVEGITGYVSRLADAHAVSVGDLVGRELHLIGAKPARPFGAFVPRNTTTASHGFRGRARAADGLGETAKRWVEALEKATLQTQLRFLTLLPFEGVFSDHGLLRRTRAWCPACYEDWRCTDDPVYEPLLWTIRLVTMCPRHGQPFEEVCPHCRETMLPLGVYARPGHCSRCLEWLGSSGAFQSFKRFSGESESSSTFWRTNAVTELLAAAPTLTSRGDTFKTNFRACIETVAEGNVLAFAKAAQMSRPGLTRLYTRQGLPELGTLLRICHQLGIPLMTFLMNDPIAAAVHWERAKESLLAGRKGHRIQLSRSREQVRLVLQKALSEQPPPSLSEIGRRLNYKRVEGLRDVDRVLSKRIAANYRKSGRSHWWRKRGAARLCERVHIRDLLEQSLAEELPRSLYALAVSLGYANEGYIQRKFPELCHAIREKIRSGKRARISDMEGALNNALTQELPPSLDEVRRRLGYSTSQVLRNHFPTLCDEILARRRRYRQQQILELKKKLRSALLESPAPPLANLGKRLNLPGHCLEKMCPHECASIRARYLRDRKETSERRKEQMRQEVHRIVQRLHAEGTYPTVERVNILLSKIMRVQWAAVYTEVTAVRQELRYSG